MKKSLYRFGLICISILTLVACSDDIVDGVHVKPESNNDESHYSLIIHLNNMSESQDEVIVGASVKDPFAEENNVEDKNFILTQKIESNVVCFNDLKDYYKQKLFFNVYEKQGDAYKILTHLGNQLEYQVTFGKVEKTIDLNKKRPDVIRRTNINITVDPFYKKNKLYLIKSDQQILFEKAIQDGHELTSDLYLSYQELIDGETKISIHSPRVKGDYLVYLLNPEEELVYLKRNLTIEYSTENITVNFQREQKKTISVSIVRGDEPMIDAEVYLILKSQWPLVQHQVSTLHGSPEPGTFVSKQIAREGKTTFSMFCTEGHQEYVIYVPKWNSDYYDSFQKKEVRVDAETSSYKVDIVAPYTPNTGGGQKRKVTFNVSVSEQSGLKLNPWSSYVYVLNDATKLKEAWNTVLGGAIMDGLTKGDIVSGYNTTVVVKNVEIDTSKEIAIFVVGMSGYMQVVPGVKRIQGLEIDKNSIDVVIDTIESL